MKGTSLFALTFVCVAQGLFVERAIYSSSSCADNKLPSVFALAQATWWGVDGEDQYPRTCRFVRPSRSHPKATYRLEELLSVGADTYSYRTCECLDAGCLSNCDCSINVTIGRSKPTCVDDAASRYYRSQAFSVVSTPPTKPISSNAGKFDEGVLLNACDNPGNVIKLFSWHPYRCVRMTGAGDTLPQYQTTNATKYIQPDGMPGVRVTWTLDNYYKDLPDFSCGTPTDDVKHFQLDSYNCAYDPGFGASSSKVKWAGGL